MINKTAKGRLKNYDGVWYVLDSAWLLQTELDKKQYGDHLSEIKQLTKPGSAK